MMSPKAKKILMGVGAVVGVAVLYRVAFAKKAAAKPGDQTPALPSTTQRVANIAREMRVPLSGLGSLGSK